MTDIARKNLVDGLLERPEIRALLLTYDLSGDFADYQRALRLMDSVVLELQGEHPPVDATPP